MPRLPIRQLALLMPLLVLGALPPAPAQDRFRTYTVVLAEPSVGERLAAARGTGKPPPMRREAATSTEHLRRAVAHSQDLVAEAIAARGIDVLGSAQNVINALFIHCSARQAQEIERIPGVAGVTRGRTFRPSLNTSSEIVRATAAHLADRGTWTGEGIKIAVIDSGIDPTHPAFQNAPRYHPPGVPTPAPLAPLPGYPKGRPQDLSFANSKIIALRSYEHLLNSGEAETSTPDEDSPLDRNAHGTAVAMIAAGHAVQTGLGVQEGIAPRARIGVYKIFGTPGVNDGATSSAVIAAIDDAVADGMDVLNMSIGGEPEVPWDWQSDKCEAGGSRHCNPDAIAVSSAVNDFGLVVVVSAGNSGETGLQAQPTFSTLSEASSVPNVISVGATMNSRTLVHSVTVGGARFEAIAGSGPMPDGLLTAGAAVAPDSGNPFGCEPFPEGYLAGSIVLLEVGDCAFVDQVENADEAGAAGVLFLSFDDEAIAADGLDSTDIPAFMLGPAASEAVEDAGVTARTLIGLDPMPVAKPADPATVAVYSSRGPTLRLNLKPDIVAPGNVYTAALRHGAQGSPYRPSGFAELEGTSFSAPIVAGAAALVWQARPNFSAREVASALINTANPSVVDGNRPAGVRSIGGGLLDVAKALSVETTVVPPTLSFGRGARPGERIRRVISVRNRSQSEHTYTLSAEPLDGSGEAAVTMNGRRSAHLTLAGGGFVRVPVEIQVPAAAKGVFEGRVRISTGPPDADLLVPYLLVVPDNLPHNSYVIPVSSGGGPEGERTEDYLAARVLDQYGAPATDVPAVFSVAEGQGMIRRSDAKTSRFGVATADVEYDPSTEAQLVRLSAGNLEIPWEFYLGGGGPEIQTVGIAGIANLHEAYAPGARVDILGSDLAPYGGAIGQSTRWVPVVLKGTSVSFDVNSSGTSVPGRLIEVSRNTLSLQVPWELHESDTATVKVNSEMHSGTVEIRIAAASPAIFLNPDIPPPAAGELGLGLIGRNRSEMISGSNPARAGETVYIYMAGNGAVRSPIRSGTIPAVAMPTAQTPTVAVGAQAAAVTSSTLIADEVGVYAVGVTVPEGLSTGVQAVQVTVAGVASNAVGLHVQ